MLKITEEEIKELERNLNYAPGGVNNIALRVFFVRRMLNEIKEIRAKERPSTPPAATITVA